MSISTNKPLDYIDGNTNLTSGTTNVCWSAEDESALKELKQLGKMTTPVIVINGAAIVRFNKSGLTKQLG